MQEGHLPVMPAEVIETLAPAAGSLQIDATVGGGGHTERILEAASPDGRVLGLDADGAAIERVGAPPGPLRRPPGPAPGELPGAGGGRARGRLRRRGRRPVRPRAVVVPAGRPRPGLRVPGRRPARHALRHRRAACRRRSCSRRSPPTSWPRCSAGTARSRPRGRSPRRSSPRAPTAPIETAEELAALIEPSRPGNPRVRRRIHPATRVFQALRIAVNEELDALEEGLAAAVDLLRPGGRLVVLSYHSLEDRIVKRFLAAERRGCTCPPEAPVCVCGQAPRLRLVTRPSLTPTDEEITANPRARSARLRAAERLAA